MTLLWILLALVVLVLLLYILCLRCRRRADWSRFRGWRYADLSRAFIICCLWEDWMGQGQWLVSTACGEIRLDNCSRAYRARANGLAYSVIKKNLQ
mgnify:CR=1 FL=1